MAASDVEDQEIVRHEGVQESAQADETGRKTADRSGLCPPGGAPKTDADAPPSHPSVTKTRHSTALRRLKRGAWGGARRLIAKGRARLRRELRARGGFSARGGGLLTPPGGGRSVGAVLAWWGLQLTLAIWRLRRLEQPRLWLIALGVGILSGYAAVLFVGALELMHSVLFGAEEAMFADAVAAAPWPLVLGAPIFGGLIVGLLLKYGGGDPTPLGVADVIEARALAQGRMDARRSSVSVLASALSLGFGASAGREGPAVLAGATVASAVSNLFDVRSGVQARTIMACAVAAAVSASFNAPIAGALFALEVVLGHYAVRAFAPITIASVAGAIVSRTHFGDNPAFLMPAAEFGSYSQLPAFALLGLVSAVAAATMMGAIFIGRDLFDAGRAKLGLPDWAQPAMAGAVLGGIFLAFPHAAAVGYQTTSEALGGAISLWGCVLFALVKIVAVGVTLGGRFAGGVFSPALMIGALTGAAFGEVAIDVFPSVSGSHALYALAGMGACAGAVLGAPISTTLIVFELTGDYGTTIAVMVSTSVATVATQQSVGRSFFHLQLARRGLDLSAGPQTFLLPSLRVDAYMRPRGAENGASDTAAWALVEQNVVLRPGDTLARAFPLFKNGQLSFIPVMAETGQSGDVREDHDDALIGALFYVDALRAYNRALVQVHEEEHG